MKSHPILFSAPMVRALLDGTKTQTRRVLKDSAVEIVTFIGADNLPTHEFGLCETHERVITKHVRCPYGQPGDRLWVRETFRSYPMAGEDGTAGFIYRATHPQADTITGWKPSIHMPRAACRLELEVTDAHIERLHELTEAGAIAEGIPADDGDRPIRAMEEALRHTDEPLELAPCTLTALECFQGLWNSINGAGAWDANPWVWVLTFRRALP